MGIQLAGGIYCPLSPRDPHHRLSELIQQTGTGLVLVHSTTTSKFTDDTLIFNIDSTLINNNTLDSDIDVDELSEVKVTPDDISYVIFTSGSTGTPKAVSNNDILGMNEMTLYVLGSSATSQFHSVDAFVCSHWLIQ